MLFVICIFRHSNLKSPTKNFFINPINDLGTIFENSIPPNKHFFVGLEFPTTLMGVLGQSHEVYKPPNPVTHPPRKFLPHMSSTQS